MIPLYLCSMLLPFMPYALCLRLKDMGLIHEAWALGLSLGLDKDAGNTSPPTHNPSMDHMDPMDRTPCLAMAAPCLRLGLTCLNMGMKLCSVLSTLLKGGYGHVKGPYAGANMATIPPTQTRSGSGVFWVDFWI